MKFCKIFISALLVFKIAITNAAIFTVTSVSDSGPGSLRQMIIDANQNSGADEIHFNINETDCDAAGVCHILILSQLPDITDEVLIDGTTQPQYGMAPANVCATKTNASYMRIEINANSFISFFVVKSNNPSTIKGLSMGGTTTQANGGVYLHGDARHWLNCNHIGVNAPGTAKLALRNGICISCSFPHGDNGLIGTNSDGVDDTAERNVIAADSRGVNINTGSNYVVAGNYMSITADGLSGLTSNSCIYARQDSHNNILGSNLDGINDAVEKNIFGSCQTGFEMEVRSGGSTNTIAGNWLGVDAKGLTLANSTVSAIVLIGSGTGTTTYLVKDNWLNSITNVAVSVGDGTSLDINSTNNCFTQTNTGLSYSGTLSNIPFINNFWGDSSGPSGVGSGTGAAILETSTGTVDYNPWRLTLPNICFTTLELVYKDGFES